MRITFLGTGSSLGVPIANQTETGSRSLDHRDQRLRTSALIQTETGTILVDPGPDFRQQFLRLGPTQVDAVFVTHEHKDHTAGMDELRVLSYQRPRPLPIYALPRTCEQIVIQNEYLFSPRLAHIFNLELVPITTDELEIAGAQVQIIHIMHDRMPIIGLRIGDLVYITDASHLDPAEEAKCTQAQVLVVNALQHEPHPKHYSLAEAVAFIGRVQPRRAWLIHIGAAMGRHALVDATLPKHIRQAYDGLEVRF